MGLADDVRDDFHQRVRDVTDFHDWLGSPNGPGAATWVIYGTGVPTEMTFSFFAATWSAMPTMG